MHRSPDLYVEIMNLYVKNLCEVAEAAWLERHIDRYAYGQWIRHNVAPAKKMAEDFEGWSVADCSWDWGRGPLEGEHYYRYIDALVRAGIPCVETDCWDRAIRQLPMGEEAWIVADKYFS